MDALSQKGRDAKRIAELNDRLRQTFLGGQVLLTSTVAQMEKAQKQKVLQAVREFSDFTPDNNPHGERDFGCFELDGTKYVWRIEYYDIDMRYGADDPADEKHTKRVLHILRADEY